jgi:hypothetical protein
MPHLRESNVGRHCVSARRDAVPAYNGPVESEALEKKAYLISPEILGSIENLLGKSACHQIVKAAERGLQRTRVQLRGVLAGGK